MGLDTKLYNLLILLVIVFVVRWNSANNESGPYPNNKRFDRYEDALLFANTLEQSLGITDIVIDEIHL